MVFGTICKKKKTLRFYDLFLEVRWPSDIHAYPHHSFERHKFMICIARFIMLWGDINGFDKSVVKDSTVRSFLDDDDDLVFGRRSLDDRRTPSKAQ